MNEVSINQMVVDDDQEEQVDKASFNFAQLLRWLGCGGVVLSAIVFLVQGFDDIGLSLRNWAYLGLMVVLGGVGIALKYAFEDGKGARLLLGLAVAVIPIQFAQLGGMIHTLTSGVDPNLSAAMINLLDFGALSWGMVAASGAATLLLAGTIGLFGFRVLARPQALSLTLMNILLCSALLIPVREGFFAIAIFLGLGVVTLLADIRLGKANTALRTTEGRGARLMLLLPLLIAGARASFYVGDVSGLAMLGGMISLAMLVGAYHYVKKTSLRELMLGTGILGVCAAWGVWSLTELNLSGAMQTLSLFVLEGLFLVAVSKYSTHGVTYRLFGSLLYGVAVIQMVLAGHEIQTSLLATGLGILLSAVGYLQKWRMPAIVGVAVIITSVLPLTFQALFNVEFGTWIGLALGGIALVVLASVVERYGRAIAHYAQSSWSEVKAWD